MRKKRYVLAVVLAAICMVGCAGANTKEPPVEEKIDFGDTKFNERVYIPASFDKRDMLVKYDAGGKEVYTLGTWHWNHFYKDADYSLHDIQSVIENIAPDAVYIECQEHIFEKYGELDGPIDMVFIYSYCKEHNIPVKLIDYWTIDNDLPKNQNSTSDVRDNEMFYNIYEKLSEEKNDARILVCYGSAHFYNQQPRMKYAGWTKEIIDDIDAMFHHNEDHFEYPTGMEKVLEGCIDYQNNGFLEQVEANVTDPDSKQLCEQMAAESADSYDLYRRMVIYKEEYFME